MAASRMKFSSPTPFKLPGITSRFAKGRKAEEFPISRHSSTHTTAAFISSGCDSMLVSIRTLSCGLVGRHGKLVKFRRYGH